MEQPSGLMAHNSFGHSHLLHRWGNGSTEASLDDSLPSKRKRNDVGNANGFACDGNNSGHGTVPLNQSLKQNRSFVLIDGCRGVYYSESWEPNHSTLYLPVSGSLLANMSKYDQISFEQGCFCIGNSAGGFQQKAQGQAIHCWRYSEQDKKLFVALSYFFTDFQVFQDVVSSLGCI